MEIAVEKERWWLQKKPDILGGNPRQFKWGRGHLCSFLETYVVTLEIAVGEKGKEMRKSRSPCWLLD